MTRFIPLLLAIFIVSCTMAQKPRTNYDERWKKVDTLINEKGLTASALKEVEYIYTLAKKEKQDAQAIKALLYITDLQSVLHDDGEISSMKKLEADISSVTTPVRNLLQSLLATKYMQYFRDNRYKLYDRTNTTGIEKTDIDTWTAEDFHDKISALYFQSISSPEILKKNSLASYEPIITKGNSRRLRPTLYDLLCHQALEYFTSDETELTKPAYSFTLNDPIAFAPAKAFIKAEFRTADTSSLKYGAVNIYQDILEFHINDAEPSAFLDADLARLAYMHRTSVLQNKSAHYKDALSALAKNYPGSEYGGMASFLRLQQEYNEASLYNIHTSSPSLRFTLVSIEQGLSEIRKNYSGTPAGAMSTNLIQTIDAKELNMETEKVNIPGIPFLSKVSYRNLKKIHYRIIALNDTDFSNERFNDKYWDVITQKKFLRAISQDLPDPGDKRMHSVEIKIDALPEGQYAILASNDPEFTLGNALLTLQYLHVSNISYISRDNHFFILHRNSGQPLPGATVQLWETKYDYTTSRQSLVKKTSHITNDNGYVNLPVKQSFLPEINWKNDRLFTRDQQYYYHYTDQITEKEKTFLFTDRSIYRPGQVVYFKGIMVALDSGGRKSHVVAGRKAILHLYDTNGEQVDSATHTTSEFGSYHGKFNIPENLATGEYSIRDEKNNAYISFSVEEYKRPSFEVYFDSIKSGYRLNDTVTMSGTIIAYAGNNLNNVAVNYRVTRKTRFPWPWRFGGWDFPDGEEMDIAHGNITTDDAGKFTIKFLAIPDLNTDKKYDPVFDFEIIADATDKGGETRAGETILSISYKALNLQLQVDAETILADSLRELKIIATNFAGQPQEVKAEVTISRLQSPGRLIRPRYWSAPDTTVMTKDEFIRLFPYDEYIDENAKSNWKQLSVAFSGSSEIKPGEKFSLGNTPFLPGWYLIEAKAIDQYGEVVTDKIYVQVINPKNNTSVQPAYVWSVKNKTTAEPGDKVDYSYGTSADNLWIIRLLDRKIIPVKPPVPVKKTKGKPTEPGFIPEGPFDIIRQHQELQTIIIPITESDRGGINISQVFIKHNRVFESGNRIMVPWTNKDLTVAVESFRDKTSPGSTENWVLKITGNKGEKVNAEILTSLYDASLDQFKSHDWNKPSVFPIMYNASTWNRNQNFELGRSLNKYIPVEYANVPEKTYDQLIWQTLVYSRYQRRTMRGDKMEVQESMMANKAVSDSAAQKVEMTKFTPPKVVRDEEVSETLSSSPSFIQTRKNFSETAFFFPDLQTDEKGNVSFSFTIPEALTRWKWQIIAHTKEMATGTAMRNILTQKDLMVQPKMPRFLREGDRISLKARISNLTNKEVSGQAWLQLIDPETQQPVDGWFKNTFPQQHFTASANQNTVVNFDVEIPTNYNKPLQYRIVAKSGENSDGEENILPVLSNRILVTESLPVIMRGSGTKNFAFTKLLKSPAEGSLTHHRFTLEYSSNPAWYGVLALPYLMEFPYECSEQNFNRFYANALASSVANSSPKIRAMFEKWRTADTAALISNLMKNQELKSILLEQTPWVMEAKSESAQRKNIALLFDLVKLAKDQASSLEKLKQMQSPNGGFVWFTGGPDDRYITQYIASGIAHLKKLNAIPEVSEKTLGEILSTAISYLDKKILEDYQELIKHKADLSKNQLRAIQVQYLYMRSYFMDRPLKADAQKAYDFYFQQAKKFWLSQSRYNQAMISMALYRKKETAIATGIIKSLKENAIRSEELGMYWKDNIRGYYWYQSPIETQAILIEAFDEVTKDKLSVEEMKLWLLSQKRMQDWGTTKATADAVYALLRNGNDWLSPSPELSIKAGDKVFTPTLQQQEAGTGYFKESVGDKAVNASMGNISVTIKNNPSGNISWGAAYWQYFEEMEKITPSATPLKLDKKFFIQKNSDKGPVLIPVKEANELKVGDKLTVRIEIRCDREMEYVHMKDLRSSGTEPINVLSQYKWQGGLGYYEATRDASTDFFFSRLPKGTWVFEYSLFVTHNGSFSAGITTIQSMYAPEFSSHSQGSRISVK